MSSLENITPQMMISSLKEQQYDSTKPAVTHDIYFNSKFIKGVKAVQ